jgi:hypothetical protein
MVAELPGTTPTFMAPEDLLTTESQKPSTGPYPEPDNSRPKIFHIIYLRFVRILTLAYNLRLRVSLPCGFYPSGFLSLM